jgi:hypothetical protein
MRYADPAAVKPFRGGCRGRHARALHRIPIGCEDNTLWQGFVDDGAPWTSDDSRSAADSLPHPRLGEAAERRRDRLPDARTTDGRVVIEAIGPVDSTDHIPRSGAQVSLSLTIKTFIWWRVAVSFYQHYHRVMQEQEAREIARRARHARMIGESTSTSRTRASILRRAVTRLAWWPRRRLPLAGPAGVAAMTAVAALVPPVATGVLEMTDAACRLPDGSIGRIAIDRRSMDDWTALCVEADQGEPPG